MSADEQAMILVLIGGVVTFLLVSWWACGRGVRAQIAADETPSIVPSGAGFGWGCLSIILLLFALVAMLGIAGGR